MARNDNNGAASKQGQLGFEADLFKAADKLRGNMEPSDYKHVALGLIFLKYISDAFEARHAQLLAEGCAAAAEDKDEYLADNIFWVPKEARWSHLQANAKQARHRHADRRRHARHREGQRILKGVLPKDYARPALNKVMLGELIDLISGIALNEGKATLQGRARPRLRILPRPVRRRRRQARRRVLHAALRGAHAGRNAGALPGPCLRPLLRQRRHVRAEREVRRRTRWAHRRHRHLRAGKQLHHLAAGQDEPRRARHRLLDIRWNNEGSFHKDELRDLKADFILANPPFNISDWGGDSCARTCAGNSARRR
jgi:type I restriction enzyme M protein